MSEQVLNDQHIIDLDFWCEELNVRAEELKEIVGLVGPSLHAIRLYLSQKLLLAWPAAF